MNFSGSIIFPLGAPAISQLWSPSPGQIPALATVREVREDPKSCESFQAPGENFSHLERRLA